ncbi:extracellular solute-binding protein [Xinfangfangia sp. CPCC 101601]|uniref:Extracellular solute-binding protein n=1 Tax=Pseudogemmobacter lacusdianii TaxID=3069608 RepID=A0ABU0VYI4_9RHOB|nr:extracellular solute-binding protein [Xinfangfangia sp. CPCC 101601]MDQ2066817.1 extracellular solute-binding protein [Xinfangfangia sp. CPCC 101601]
MPAPKARKAAQAKVATVGQGQQVAALGLKALGLTIGAALCATVLASSLRAETADPAAASPVITSHGISTFGDLKLPADFKHLPYVNPEAPKGGEMSQAWLGGFDSMNPFTVKGRAALGSTIMLESILTGTADEIGAAYCLLCTTMEYPEDRSWVIFNLREDVRFSDGTPLTAEDVLFSFDTLRTKGLNDFRVVFNQYVADAEVLDPHRIKFTFVEGVPTRDLPEMVGGLSVFSKAHYEANGLDLAESTLTPYLGSGAYSADPKDVKPGRSVTYRRNPDYWGEKLPMNIGQNNFDAIRYEFFSDSNAAFEAFKAGAYTFRRESSSKAWATQYDFPALKEGDVVKAELTSGAKAPGQAFVFNLRRGAWQDARVRQAIGMMFNFEWSNKTLFYGLYARVTSFWDNTEMAAKGAPSAGEAALLQPLVDEGLLPATILTAPAVLPAQSSPDRQLDRRNLRAASDLLDAAGWEVGSDGKRRNAEGKLLTLEILNDNSQFDRLISPFVENLVALGVDAKLVNIDGAEMEVRVRNPEYNFDLITDHMQTSYIPGTELKQYFGGETADISVFNAMGLRSPAVDRLIETVIAATTRDEMETATRALDRVLRAESFWIPQWFNNKHWVAYYNMYEHPAELPLYVLGETSLWWYNADKAAALKAKGVLK